MVILCCISVTFMCIGLGCKTINENLILIQKAEELITVVALSHTIKNNFDRTLKIVHIC